MFVASFAELIIVILIYVSGIILAVVMLAVGISLGIRWGGKWLLKDLSDDPILVHRLKDMIKPPEE